MQELSQHSPQMLALVADRGKCYQNFHLFIIRIGNKFPCRHLYHHFCCFLTHRNRTVAYTFLKRDKVMNVDTELPFESQKDLIVLEMHTKIVIFEGEHQSEKLVEQLPKLRLLKGPLSIEKVLEREVEVLCT